MTELNKDWDKDDKIYTVVRNLLKNSKIVLSSLEGIEIAPLQTLDLRTRFRKAQLADASAEIYHHIQNKAMEDLSEGADKRSDANAPESAAVGEEMRKKMVTSLEREISGSSSISYLEDLLKHREPEVAKAAKVRIDQLMGLRDDEGAVLPGAEEEVAAKPTEVGPNLVT